MLSLCSGFRADLDERRVLAGVAGVDGREVRRQPDVGDDHLQVIFANDVADVVFHARDVCVGASPGANRWAP